VSQNGDAGIRASVLGWSDPTHHVSAEEHPG
jgi:hypothetical protein